MVANLRSAFSVLITDNPWLAPEDKVTAQEKLDYIQEFVAYPDWIMNDTLLTSAYEGVSNTIVQITCASECSSSIK